jgi:hypothetical protein
MMWYNRHRQVIMITLMRVYILDLLFKKEVAGC